MKIAQEQLPYLKGDQYTNSLHVKFVFDQQDFTYLTRFQLLEQLCKGKNVVHVGFVDHTPESIDKKLKNDKWLHEKLCRICTRCYGLDINKTGVDYVKNTLGYKDVECIDILKQDSEAIFSNKWSYLLIPDVLEHQNNPVDFLAGFARRFKGVAEEIVITVPNGLAQETFQMAKQNIEAINSDHRFWFTPYTLAKVITEAGLTVKEIRTCRSGTIKSWTWFKNRYYAKRPLVRNNLVAIVSW